jgi:hypothetical protein
VWSTSHDDRHEVSLRMRFIFLCYSADWFRVHLAQIGYPAPRALSKLEDQVFCF